MRRASPALRHRLLSLLAVVGWGACGGGPPFEAAPRAPDPAPSASPATVDEATLDPELQSRRRRLVEAARKVAGDDPRRPASPVLLVDGDGAGEALPLVSTTVQVEVTGAVAEVRMAQLYRHRGRRPIEAIYVFPASTRAAVHGLRMTIGQRVTEAELRERATARAAYEEARQGGVSAALLEQQRPNVFQMQVANVLPGEEVRVELTYVELLVPEERTYELVVPAVVGPRYMGAAPAEAAGWATSPRLERAADGPTFAVDVELRAGLPLVALESPSHAVEVERLGEDRGHLALMPSREAGDRDFIVRYRTAGDAIGSGVLVQGPDSADGDGFFQLTVEPPARLERRTILPREYLFVVDVSGSMAGFPLAVAKELMRGLLAGLGPEERFNLLLFSGGSALLAPRSLPASPENLRRACRLLDREQGGGGTELLPALEQAFALPREAGRPRLVIVVTDGYVSVEKEAFALARRRLGDGNLFAFGVGTSVNRHLIEGLARAGQGEPFVVEGPEAAAMAGPRFRRYVEAPLLDQVGVRCEGCTIHDLEPPVIPMLLAERPLVVVGRLRGAAAGELVVSGRSAIGLVEHRLPLARASRADRGSPVPLLWARRRIERLSEQIAGDDDATTRGAITKLGLAYRLLTPFTSFVAVDGRRRTVDGATPVVQPLAIPEGVGSGLIGTSGLGPAFGLGGLGIIGSGGGGGHGAGYGSGSGSSARGPAGLGGRGASATVSLGRPAVHGSVDRELVRRLLRRRHGEIRLCHERARRLHPRLAGRFVLDFTIRSDGHLEEVAAPGLGDPAFERCLVDAAGRWVFPRPRGGGTVRVHFPFAVGP